MSNTHSQETVNKAWAIGLRTLADQLDRGYADITSAKQDTRQEETYSSLRRSGVVSDEPLEYLTFHKLVLEYRSPGQ